MLRLAPRSRAAAVSVVAALIALTSSTLPGCARERTRPLSTSTSPDVRARPLSRPGDGQPVCGLGPEFHAGRRAALRQVVQEGLIVVRGLPDTRDYVNFRQDKNFWYLTGVESPGASLLMDAATGLEVLFLPARDAQRETWEGERWDAEDTWVPELTGLRSVRPDREFTELLDELSEGRAALWTPLWPHVALAGCHDRALPFDKSQLGDELDGRPSRERRLADVLTERYAIEVRDLSPLLNTLRLVKTPEEVAALERAAHAGALAMMEAMRSTRPGLGEWDLRAVMDLVHRRAGADGPAYDAIVGSGPNSVILHYWIDDRVLRPGEMICLDYGPEVDHYTTDITRSWPTDGVFTPRMAELYDVVLAAQAAGIAAARPGGTIFDVEAACQAVIAERGLTDLVRHGSCHWLGLEVHDVGDYPTPLVPGCVFTIEPGLYDEEAQIGIRIEDVVVITETGCDVITDLVPKARDTVAALVSEQGVLDWMDGAVAATR